MELKGASCIVIGGAGFIGSHIVKELLKQEVSQVCIYDNFSRGTLDNIAASLQDTRCILWKGDIRETDVLDAALQGKDYVFCTAALWLLHCKDYPRSAFDVNIAGTFNVLEACVKHKIKKLIWSSSASVYGDAVEVPMTEEHPFLNKNFYGATKIAGEAMATAFHERYGLQVIGLRYMNVYGPGQDQTAAYTGVIPIMLNKIDAGETPIINGDGSQAYDFIYVEDVARCNVLALKADIPYGFYNVGTEVQTSIKSLCETILQLKGVNLTVQYQPYSDNDARAMVQNRIGSKAKAKKDLGFEYQISLEQGLKQLIDWRGRRG